MQFEHNAVYLGVGYKKKYKAPTDHVICLKHPKIQNMKSKHIIYLCTDDSKAMYQWVTGIRMAKVILSSVLDTHHTSFKHGTFGKSLTDFFIRQISYFEYYFKLFLT